MQRPPRSHLPHIDIGPRKVRFQRNDACVTGYGDKCTFDSELNAMSRLVLDETSVVRGRIDIHERRRRTCAVQGLRRNDNRDTKTGRTEDGLKADAEVDKLYRAKAGQHTPDVQADPWGDVRRSSTPTRSQAAKATSGSSRNSVRSAPYACSQIQIWKRVTPVLRARASGRSHPGRPARAHCLPPARASDRARRAVRPS